jgi:hypothetical protein
MQAVTGLEVSVRDTILRALASGRSGAVIRKELVKSKAW